MRTSSAEEVGEHVEGVLVMLLTALVGLESFLEQAVSPYTAETKDRCAHLAMPVVDLTFLR